MLSINIPECATIASTINLNYCMNVEKTMDIKTQIINTNANLYAVSQLVTTFRQKITTTIFRSRYTLLFL